MDKNKKYKGKQKTIDKLVERLNFKKSEFEDNIKINGIGNRVFSYLSTGKKKYPLSKFDELANSFNKKLKELNINEEITGLDLVVDEKNLNDNKLENFFNIHKEKDHYSTLNKVESCEALSDYGNKVIVFTKLKVNPAIAEDIASILELYKSYADIQSKKLLSSEDNLELGIRSLRTEGLINEKLQNLNDEHNINLYHNMRPVTVIGFSVEPSGDPYGDHLDKFHADATVLMYSFLLFTNTLEENPKIHYSINEFFKSDIEFSTFLMENPYSFEDQGGQNLDYYLDKINDFYSIKHKKWFPKRLRESDVSFSNLKPIKLKNEKGRFEKLKKI